MDVADLPDVPGGASCTCVTRERGRSRGHMDPGTREQEGQNSLYQGPRRWDQGAGGGRRSRRWERLPWPGLSPSWPPAPCLVLLAILATLIRPTVGASFYGSSYVSLPLQDAKSSTDISFKFRTSRPESLLVLVAGKTDYCLIMLQQGVLKVHINLGAGESEVSSPRGNRLDDLAWHTVELVRTEAEIQLTIDKEHTARAKLPGRFYELNIHYGVFVGGMGDFNEIFLGNQKNFRGCLENVVFNSIDVMTRAEEQSSAGGKAKVSGIQWECSAEFDAGIEEPISYLTQDSFVAFPNWISRSGAVLSLSVKTSSRAAVLAYNAGQANSNDFVAVELRKGKVRLLLDQGNGVQELRHDTVVSDGSWHRISATFKPDRLEISVDGVTKYSAPSRGANRHIDLTDRLYIGGIQLKKKSRAIRQGVKSGSSALQGCLKDVTLEGRDIGLPDVVESQGVRPGCHWTFPCLQSNTCKPGETCSQDGLAGYQCACDSPPCSGLEEGSSVETPPPQGDFVLLKSLQVEEGSQAVITTENIKVLPDFAKMGVPHSGVLFHLIEFPSHGELTFGKSSKRRKVFSLEHLLANKLRYLHNGNEDITDNFVFEMEIEGPDGASLPPALSMRQRFLFEIRILPVNDPPSISGTKGQALLLAAGSKVQLEQNFLQVTDPDSKIDAITIKVVYNDTRAGFIEDSGKPGEQLDSFPLATLLGGKISYVQKGLLPTHIGFKAWDGEHESEEFVVGVQTFALSLLVVNNTGLLVSPGGSAVISAHNLTFTTNSPEQDFDIRLEITSGPNYGKVQRQRSNGKWVSTKRFSQRQVEKEKIRYVHSRGNPRLDYVTFAAQVNGVSVGKSFTFSIKFINVNINAVNNKGLALENVGESVITERDLQYQTFPQETPPANLVYTLISPPQQGDLFITSASGKAGSRLRRLEAHSNFSQVEILSGRLKYKLIGKVYSIIHDKFTFAVSTPKQSSEPQTFTITYSPGDTTVDITLESCEVEEGGRKVITNKYLEIRTLDFGSFVYNITTAPVHGWVSVLAPNKVDIGRPQTDYFTSLELSDHRLFYTHDDSESRRDSFAFIATKHGGSGFQYKATFHIHVLLRNDQTPTRAVDKVFHVVEGGERLLTKADLLFVDMDIDTKPEDIKFESRATPNGELVYAEDPAKRVSEFTQRDINDRRILFRHKGSNFGRILIWVNDGQLWVSTELKVRASPPFVKLENNTGLIVQRGDSGTISQTNLSTVTNMNIEDEAIVFRITEGPFYGHIFLDDEQVDRFSTEDIVLERLEYRNNDNSSLKDYFRFQVSVGEEERAQGEFLLHVYPESYWDGLEIGSNNSLLVEEGTSVRVTHQDLRVIHGQMAAQDIRYIVTTEPRHGFLELDPPNYGPAPLPSVAMVVEEFTQALIDEGRLHYVQSMSNQTSDTFTFDVTNGISTLSGLVFHFIIIPKDLYIETRPVRVVEGGQASLSPENLHVLTSFYEERVADFLIIQAPSHGRLVAEGREGSNASLFTLSQLAARQIKYLHDGSDSLLDSLQLVARTAGEAWPDKDKTSVPATLHFSVQPVNDAVPRLVNNTGLTLWAGSSVAIPTSSLGASDSDTAEDNITFSISSPHCGMVSLISRPSYPVSSFTQQQLAKDQVLFTHSGCLAGGFSLQLSDGLNSVSRRQFAVTVQQLALREASNRELALFPGMEAAILPSTLEVVTTDPGSQRTVVFLVTKGPAKGRLLQLSGAGRYAEVQNFTQADINASRIFYRHEKPFTDLKDFDSFSFEAMAEYAPYRLKSDLKILISVTAKIPGGIDRYISLSPVTCQEGGNITVYPQNLNTSGLVEFIQRGRGVALTPGSPHLRLRVTASPLRGQLSLGVRQVRAGDLFSQQDVDGGLLRYSHDHSDSTEDRVGLAVLLAAKGQGGKDLLVWEGQLNISITPVNDRMPHLVTKNPSMVVVRGQIKTLSRDMLEVRDPDTQPRDILYTLMDNSLQGRIVFQERLTHGISHFTQADINAERVLYQHDGSSAQTQFYFSVTDGRFQPRETGLSRHFRIHVIPLTLVLQNYSAIALQQGTTTAFITSANMGAATNGRKHDIQYTVTIPPKGGQLLVEDRPAEVFWQINIDRDEVVYMQTDMSLSVDNFTADISNQDNKIPGLVFNITVLPLVKQEEQFVANIDSSTPLNIKHLDATKLAGLTASNPVYYLLSSPKLGQVKRIIRTSRTREPRSLRDRIVNHFTHEDIKNRVIYFVGSGASLQRNVTDMLRYRLEAPGVQPATGLFTFKVTQSGVTPWQPLPNVTPTGHVPLPTLASRKDVVIAISVIASVLLIIVTAILFVKCRMGKEEERSKRQHIHNCQLADDRRSRKQGQFDDIYDACGGSGVLSLNSSHPTSPRLGGERYEVRNGTLPRTGLGLRGNQTPATQRPASDSDSWMESSRSRDTSPSSSIPPSLPAFRVIPLCESESSGTHLSDPPLLPPFPRSSRDFPPQGAPPGESSAPGSHGEVGQPLLRKNQYWV